MSITIIKPGLLDTLQDMGRYGFSHLGINPGGAMDRYAAQAANLLVGNETPEAVLELHFPGAQILFEQNALISVTGADFCPMLNDEQIPRWQPVVVRKNTVLHFPKLQQGARCYLAVHGGFCVERWLNSYSTNLKAGAGGFKGRKLEKGDELPFRENRMYVSGLLKEGKEYQILRWQVATGTMYEHPNEIYIIEGQEWEQLAPQSKLDVFENNFIIHPFSDRMGYQLKGIPLQRMQREEILSSGVSFGTLQLLPSGQMIVLMADHQTTGGYPRLGHVISAHLPKLAQLRPSDCIQFKMTDIATAENMLMAQQQELNILRRACFERLNQVVC
jgi:antagonist of KipI